MTIDLNKVPRNSDNKPFMVPVIHHDHDKFIHAGSSDDIANGVRWDGPLFELSRTDAGDALQTFQFLEWVRIAGAHVTCTGNAVGDHVHGKVFAPSSAPAASSNPGAGAYDKYNLGTGMNVFIPNGTQTGDWDLDLSSRLNANCNITKVCPVTAEDGDGWFDYDSDTGDVTLNTTQTGWYNLFDFDVPLLRIIPKAPLPFSGFWNLAPANVRPMLLLPHWKLEVTLTRATSGTVSVNWILIVERAET